MTSITADPKADLDYGFDLSDWLATGETVSALIVSADTGITVQSQNFTSTLIVAWLTGGTPGENYAVHFQFSTNQGRTDVRSLQILVTNR
jgi:hypothetical protein